MPDTKDTFNSIATVYDKINDIISLGRHKDWKSFFISNADFDGKILDIATGTGDIISSIKKIYPNTDCYGIDPSKNMLSIARQKNIGINFIEAYSEELPFPENSFDFITISFGIRNTLSIDKSLKEIHRVLKKKQNLLVMEFSKNENFFLKILTNLYLFLIIPIVGLVYGKFKEYFYLSKSISNFYTPNEFKKLLETNFFLVDSVQSFNFGLVTIYKARKI